MYFLAGYQNPVFFWPLLKIVISKIPGRIAGGPGGSAGIGVGGASGDSSGGGSSGGTGSAGAVGAGAPN